MPDVAQILERYGVLWGLFTFLLVQWVGVMWFVLYQSKRLERRLVDLLAEAIGQALQVRSTLDAIERITVHDIRQLRRMLEDLNASEALGETPGAEPGPS
jgi:hypothetical protein